MPHDRRPIVILGPTAGGKSELAVRLAERLRTADFCIDTVHGGRDSGGDSGGGEVIGADSMQVYRHLDAGTAKPTPAQRRRTPHHMIDIVEPTERFTVTDWLALADRAITDIQVRGRRPIVVGGTNLYLKALLEGMFDGPPADRAFRASLADTAPPELHRRLSEVDPDAAARIKPNDRQRLTRALEVFHLTGEPISALQQQWTERPADEYRHRPVLIGLAWPVEAINTRINLRVKAMFYPDKVEPELAADVCIGGESLPEEVRRLVDQRLLGVDDSRQADEAIGYKQCLAALRGAMTWEDAFEKTKVATRRFAKQQRTWLKRFAGVQWIDADGLSPEAMCSAALKALTQTNSARPSAASDR